MKGYLLCAYKLRPTQSRTERQDCTKSPARPPHPGRASPENIITHELEEAAHALADDGGAQVANVHLLCNVGGGKIHHHLGQEPKEHRNKRPFPHLRVFDLGFVRGAVGRRITPADPQQNIRVSAVQHSWGSGITPKVTWAQPPPQGALSLSHQRPQQVQVIYPMVPSSCATSHMLCSNTLLTWTPAQHIPSGGNFKDTAVQDISPIARWLCAYCCTFFLLPIAGGWTPLINKLLSCFDTKSFLKWTLIKPLQEKKPAVSAGAAEVPQIVFCLLPPWISVFMHQAQEHTKSAWQNIVQSQDNKAVTWRQFLFPD